MTSHGNASTTDERADLLEALADAPAALPAPHGQGLTDEQAGQRTTASDCASAA